MKQVLKFQFMTENNSIVTDFTKPFRVVSVGEQDGRVTAWVEVLDVNEYTGSTHRLQLAYFATGQYISEGATYIGTVLMQSGLVWHVYEVK